VKEEEEEEENKQLESEQASEGTGEYS